MDPIDETRADDSRRQADDTIRAKRETRMRGQDGTVYLSESELAARLNMSVKWVQKKRHEGGGVPYHRFGSRVRYLIADVLEFEARARRLSTSDPGP